MLGVVVIAGAVFAGFLLCVFALPKIRIGKVSLDTFWLAPFIGALVLLFTGLVSATEIWRGFTSSSEMNPLKILALFFGMTMISVYLDEAGFFKYIAVRASKSGTQMGFFIKVYVLVSVLTVFTSNDIVILTFTPFLCAYCKRAEVPALPFLVMEFVAANTWSMLLIIGNPTNIYLATAMGFDFAEYVKVMALPTLFAGVTSFGLLLLLFRRQLKVPFTAQAEVVHLKDKFMTCCSLAVLCCCIVMLVVSSFVQALQMWYIAVIAAALLTVIALVYRFAVKERPKVLAATFARLPYVLVPFVLCMFVLVLAMSRWGITEQIAKFLGAKGEVWVYGGISFVAANLLNNIPMSVLFAEVASSDFATFAVIVSSNIGALLTPVGALAGIMWSNITAKYDEKITAGKFIKYCGAVAVPTLAAGLCGLVVMQCVL